MFLSCFEYFKAFHGSEQTGKAKKLRGITYLLRCYTRQCFVQLFSQFCCDTSCVTYPATNISCTFLLPQLLREVELSFVTSAKYNLAPVHCAVCYCRERDKLEETFLSVTLVQRVLQHRNTRSLVVARQVAQVIA